MRILITGICGFVGSSIAVSLLEQTENITLLGIDNLSRPGSELNRQKLQRLGVRFIHGDIRNASDIDQLPAVDWVIDAAANPSVLAGVSAGSTRQLVEHNLSGTVNLLEYCSRHKAGFILLSTSRVYAIDRLSALPVIEANGAFRLDPAAELPIGVSAEGINEQFSTEPPLSLYGTTKRTSELLAQEYGALAGFPVWINRCGVIAGAGQFGKADQGILSYWIHCWKRRLPLRYIGFGGHGFQVRDVFHPRDLTSLLKLQLQADSTVRPRIVNLGGGLRNSISLKNLSDWASERLGAHTVSPDPSGRPFDIPWVVMDHGLASKVWGWAPQVSLESILEEIALHAESNPDWLDLASSC